LQKRKVQDLPATSSLAGTTNTRTQRRHGQKRKEKKKTRTRETRERRVHSHKRAGRLAITVKLALGRARRNLQFQLFKKKGY